MADQERKEPSVFTDDGEDAALIDWRDRDHQLKLLTPGWGSEMSPSWTEVRDPARHFYRELGVGSDPENLVARLSEWVVRFPSAPIYGINRKAEYNIKFPERPNMHTLRVVTAAKENPGPVTRVFLLHNGLNETTNLRFYYRLATWILNEDQRDKQRSACVIAPFPGHLMHAPFPGPFAQTPLARYLGDSGELFRQFLRYMVETRWLLSMITPDPLADWMIGGSPLPKEGLAANLLDEWLRQRQASRHVWLDRRVRSSFAPKIEESLLGPEIDEKTVQSSIDVLTNVLDLDQAEPSRLPVHVIGYSLGGFVAQSVFFAWPNIVSSCSTICSGGAIRALSPTAFAHSEEWQAVLHTLRPELEESMLAGRISRAFYRIAGIAEDQFGYYQRIFDQVFLQEDNASYKARLSEYGTRMLFISGGEDPIVKTREVLDASPDEGITMLSIASLTHFLGERSFSERETEQREFWLPEAGGLIGRAARRAEVLKDDAFRDAQREYEKAHGVDGETEEEETDGTGESERDQSAPKPPKEPPERDLGSPEFEEALDWVIDNVTPTGGGEVGSGWLFICRAGLPSAFLGSDMHRAWGAGLHHHDVSVQRYAAALARRAEALRKIEDRATLLLPGALRRTFVESGSGLVDPHSDAPGYLTTEKQRDDAWEEFIERWGDRARWLAAGKVSEGRLGGIADQAQATFAERVSHWQRLPQEQLLVTHLPDVWISIKDMQPRRKPVEPERAIADFLEMISEILAEEPPVPLQSTGPIRAKGDAGQDLETDLEDGRVRIVRVSGAELNPRYRGRFEQAFWPSLLLLSHCAAALMRSNTEPDPELEEEAAS